MKIIFAGTPDFAAVVLGALRQSGHEIVLVLTQPDRPAGRGRHVRVSPVKQLALSNNLPVMQPSTLRDDGLRDELAALGADAMAVAAFGMLLPPGMLAAPRLGCVNVHASLLPRWRGAAPIQRAILAGDGETGISIMQMDAGLDTGPVLLQHPVAIAQDETAGSLHDKLAQLGGECLVTALHGLESGTLVPGAQDDSAASYAPKLTKAEARIDWTENANAIGRKIRALNPVPGAYASVNGAALKIWKASTRPAPKHPAGTVFEVAQEFFSVACGEGALRVEEAQRPGANRLAVAELLRGFSLAPGDRFD